MRVNKGRGWSENYPTRLMPEVALGYSYARELAAPSQRVSGRRFNPSAGEPPRYTGGSVRAPDGASAYQPRNGQDGILYVTAPHDCSKHDAVIEAEEQAILARKLGKAIAATTYTDPATGRDLPLGLDQDDPEWIGADLGGEE